MRNKHCIPFSFFMISSMENVMFLLFISCAHSIPKYIPCLPYYALVYQSRPSIIGMVFISDSRVSRYFIFFFIVDRFIETNNEVIPFPITSIVVKMFNNQFFMDTAMYPYYNLAFFFYWLHVFPFCSCGSYIFYQWWFSIKILSFIYTELLY